MNSLHHQKQFKKDFPNAKLKSKETSSSQKSPKEVKQKTYTVDNKPVKVSVEDEESFLKDFPQSKPSGVKNTENKTGEKKYYWIGGCFKRPSEPNGKKNFKYST